MFIQINVIFHKATYNKSKKDGKELEWLIVYIEGNFVLFIKWAYLQENLSSVFPSK